MRSSGKMSQPTCIPVPIQAGERRISFTALYGVSLTLSAGKKVISNDVNADHKDIALSQAQILAEIHLFAELQSCSVHDASGHVRAH
jgi:hypothetical protein